MTFFLKKIKYYNLIVKEKLIRFRRFLFLNNYDFEYITNELDLLRKTNKDAFNMAVIFSATKSEFDQKIARINKEIVQIKSNHTKFKNNIYNEFNKNNDAIGVFLDNLSKKLGKLEASSNKFIELHKSLEVKVHRLQDTSEINISQINDFSKKYSKLNKQYEEFIDLDKSMASIHKKHDEMKQLGDFYLSMANEKLIKIDNTSMDFRKAIEIQARAHIAELQAILKEAKK